MLNAFFFLFPFFLYLGIALQGLSYYFIGIIIPSLFIVFKSKKIPTYFIKVGCILMLLHIIFPIISLFIYFFPNTNVDQSIYKIALRWPGILQSNFPSSLFFGGLAFIIFTAISHLRAKNFVPPQLNVLSPQGATGESKPLYTTMQPLKSFLSGLAFASVLFTCLMVYQHSTGINFHSLFRKNIEYLSSDELLQTGGYRVWGFYGHPLTIAGVCLAYSIFSWTLLCSFTASTNKFSWTFLPGIKASLPRSSSLFQTQYLPILYLALITFSNIICLMMSGGRTAGVVGITFLIFIPLIFNLRKSFLTTLFLVMLIALGSFFIAQKLGMLNRIELVTKSFQNNNSFDSGNNRQYFWRTYEKMFLDKPIIGQGNYWLKQGVREEYYNKLGYESLPEKYIAHNVYLETLGTTGLLGFTWILVCLIYLGSAFKKNIFYKESPLKPVSCALLLAFIANLLHGLTQNVFFDSSVDYIYLGLIVAVMWDKVFGDVVFCHPAAPPQDPSSFS